MNQKNLRRIIAATSAVALATGLTATLGAGNASAASKSVSWTDSYTTFQRTVSNTNPAVGETFTMTTTFGRTGEKSEQIQGVKDLHHPCLTFVNAKPISELKLGSENAQQDYARVGGTWDNKPGGALSFTFTYKVGENCPTGVPLTSAMHYGGNFGHGEYENKGPNITIGAGGGTGVAGSMEGLGSLGNLGSLGAVIPSIGS